jgi:hypothetical protein
METQEKKNESTLSFEKQEDLDDTQEVPYGIRKVVLMKKLASKRDKILVITG